MINYLYLKNNMILQNNFYYVSELTSINDYKFDVEIQFNQSHKIFEAHFPNQPIVPGACLTQISKELIESYFSHQINILNFKSLKFIKTIDPNEYSIVTFKITVSPNGSDFVAQISIGYENIIFCKLDYQYSISHD